MEQQAPQNKLAARQCLMAADKFIKDSLFVEAKKEIEKAKKLDPSNLYISAFIDRINYFENEKNHASKAAKPIPSPKVPQPAVTAPAPKAPQPVAKVPAPKVQQPAATVPAPKAPQPAVTAPAPKAPQPAATVPAPKAPQPAATVPAPKAPQPAATVPAPKAPQPGVPSPSTPQINSVTAKQTSTSDVQQPKKTPEPVVVKQPGPSEHEPEQPVPVQVTPPVEQQSTPEQFREQGISPAKVAPPPTPVHPQEDRSEPSPVASPSIREPRVEPSITEAQLVEMKYKIDLLTKALEEEKKAREDMNRQQLQQAIAQYRSKLEKAWTDGAPSDEKSAEFDHLSLTLGIPENVVRTIQREVKIEMYGRAVKEVISKRQLLRSSSSTLEWLRKVYKISLEEYLEYESKFLMDLVADQYKGTILQISADDETKKEITPRLKSMGYAVVTSPSPEDALEKIDKLNPNLIVCESNFGAGSISGIRFLHILRTNSKFGFIPFIFLSNEEDFALLTSSELRPNEGFVKKPTNFDELSALINTKLLWFRQYIMSLSK